MKLSIQEILEACQGELLQGELKGEVTSLSTDSRSLEKGDTFLCLVGEKFDGHHYIEEVIQKGAAGIILQKKYFKPHASLKIHFIGVEDTLHALGNIGRAWRRKFSIPLIGIGGSNGKTTTKDMTAAVISAEYNTLATEGNLNNLIGVPKMLLKLNPKHQAAVIEMGMNDFGEMKRLTEIAEPTIGLLTNTGFEHIEKMIDLEGVAHSNAEMFERMPSGSLALINADDPYISKMSTHAYKLSFGMEKAADIFCTRYELNDKGIILEIRYMGKVNSFEVPAYGKANVKNALAALSVGFALGIEPAKMRKSLATYKGRAMRMEILKLKQGITILNDCYNANPSSVIAALETLSSIKNKEGGLALLGEMLELGGFAEQGHRWVGEAVAKNKISHLISIGPFAKSMVESAQQAGLKPECCVAFSTQEEAHEKISTWVPESVFILVKGSRGARMEKISEYIKMKFG